MLWRKAQDFLVRKRAWYKALPQALGIEREREVIRRNFPVKFHLDPLAIVHKSVLARSSEEDLFLLASPFVFWMVSLGEQQVFGFQDIFLRNQDVQIDGPPPERKVPVEGRS